HGQEADHHPGRALPKPPLHVGDHPAARLDAGGGPGRQLAADLFFDGAHVLFRHTERFHGVTWSALYGKGQMPNVQSVVRAFHLLEALTAGDLGITELAERTELPKSTVARLVRTLERIGAVERADEDGRYRIGAQIVNLAGVASPTANLISIVRPHLRLLADLTGEDAGLSVP